MTSTAAALLMDRLGLTEDELCDVLDVDPLTVITGELDHKPQLPILLALTEEAADRVLTMDLHAGQIQGFFRNPVDHMTALFMLTQYFDDLGLTDLVVVAPDAGRVKLNKKFASKLGAELAILDKERPARTRSRRQSPWRRRDRPRRA